MNDLFLFYTDKLGSEEEAIRRICMKFDIYYNESLAEASRKISADRSRIHTYVSRANLTQYRDKTYDTTLDEEATSAVTSMEDVNELERDGSVEVTKKAVKTWGFGLNPEDYGFLSGQFDDWKAKCVIDGKARETLVRDLCMLKLQQNKALLAGDIKTYKDLTEQFQKTLDRANLTPKQEDAADKASEKPMGVMIDMFECERPIPEPLDEWKDVDGIMKLILVYFIGHLCRMLGLKNKYAAMYEQEMAKYTVTVPEMEEADAEDIFDYLLENGFPPVEEGAADAR